MSKKISHISLTRLSYRAGIKTMTDDCYDVINDIIKHKIDNIIRNASYISNERKKKMIMPEDIHCAMNILGMNVVQMSKPCDEIFASKK